MTTPRNNPETIVINGEPVQYWRVDNDLYGNPRFVVHYLSVAKPNESYESVAKRFGKRYRAKWFGGGIVFQSYNVRASLEAATNAI